MRRLQFFFERLLQRGPLARILLAVGLIGLVSLLFGALAWQLGRPESFAAGVWWAFLHLSDPGYLGDDRGFWLRLLGTVVTVAGYVLFLGALVAIMNQWLAGRVDQLQRGITPIERDGHVVLLGRPEATAPLARRLMIADQRLVVTVLFDDLDVDRRDDFRSELGSAWDRRRILLRGGSALQRDEVARVAPARSRAIILAPPGRTRPPAINDALTARCLNVLGQFFEGMVEAPPVACAVADDRRLTAIATGFERFARPVASNELLARMAVQGLCCPAAIAFLGLVVDASSTVRLQPAAAGFIVEGKGSTRLVTAQRSPGHCCPAERLVILGWQDLVVAVIDEVLQGPEPTPTITVVSTLSVAERRAQLEALGDRPGLAAVEHIEADSTLPEHLQGLGFASGDQVLLFDEGGAEDAALILSLIALRHVLPADHQLPIVAVAEDEDTRDIARLTGAETLVRPQVEGYLLGAAVLEPTTATLLNELFATQAYVFALRQRAGEQHVVASIDGDRLRVGGTAETDVVLSISDDRRVFR